MLSQMFNVEYRRVTDPNRPLTHRGQALCHCIEYYCWLTKQSFHATYLRLGESFGFDFLNPPDGIQLDKAVVKLRSERSAFLVKLHSFAKSRRIEKVHGRRQPTKLQQQMLYVPDWIQSGENVSGYLKPHSA